MKIKTREDSILSFFNRDYSIYIENVEFGNSWISIMAQEYLNEIRPFIYLLKLCNDTDSFSLSFKSTQEFGKFVSNLLDNKERIADILKREVKPIIKEFENDQ